MNSILAYSYTRHFTSTTKQKKKKILYHKISHITHSSHTVLNQNKPQQAHSAIKIRVVGDYKTKKKGKKKN